MKEFWNLVSFEYKKILFKRSVQVTLLLSILVTAFSVTGTLLGSSYVDGMPTESNYNASLKDRAFARALAERPLDGNLIMDAVDAYKKIPIAAKYTDTEEYQTIARPYSEVYRIVRSVFRFNMENFQALTPKQADKFYEVRREWQEQLIGETYMSARAKEQVLDLDSQIKTPFIFSYTDGYSRFFVIVHTLGLIAPFAMAICLAPLFSGEYTSRADQLILSSKLGKNILIAAKLFTGFSLAAIICLVLLGLSFGLSLVFFGTDGVDAPLQLYIPLSPYPLTMGETTLLLAICAFWACLMTAAFTMLLSAKLTSPFGVIILISTLLIAPMLGSVSEQNLFLHNLYHLFPTQMSSLWSIVTSGIQYELLGLIFKPYLFLPLFATIVSVVLIPFIYRSFRDHQIF